MRLNEQNMKLLMEAMFSDASIEEFLNVCENVITSPLSFSSWIDGNVSRSKGSKTTLSREGDAHAQYVVNRLTHLENRKVTRTQGGPGIPNGNYLCWAVQGKVRYGLIVIPRQDGIDIDDDLIVFIGQCIGQICARQNVARLMTPDELLDGLLKKRIDSEAQLYALPGIEGLRVSLQKRKMILMPFTQEDIQRTGSFISMHIHNNFEDVWCAWEDRGFLALIQEKPETKKTQERQLKSLAAALSCPICLGGTVESFMDIPNAFAWMMSIPALRSAQPGDIVQAELYPEARLIYTSGLSIKELQKLAFPLVDQMEAYDKENHTEYLHTVRVYMENRFNATVTAQKLFIHTNTVFYRLDRIRELWNVDILDANVLYNLLMSFRLREYR